MSRSEKIHRQFPAEPSDFLGSGRCLTSFGRYPGPDVGSSFGAQKGGIKMRKKFVLILVTVLISAGAVTPSGLVGAQGAGTQAENAKIKEEASKPVAEPKVFVTPHSGRFGNETVAYTATAGETYLLDDKGEPKASIFSFAYVKDGVKEPAARPVTFLWNGGPGSSSIWLHMGSMGPRRVEVPSDAKDAGPPPYKVENNTQALLDVTDLVFVDPIGTGFSHALGKHENKEFWGLNEDADSVAEFIRTWVTRNKRWVSPKYLLGESFGTTRAAAVAGRLEGGSSAISLNGLILISQALDYTGSTPEPDNLIAYVTYLPTMAATAWYHGKVKDRPTSLQEFLQQARAFSVDSYAPALFKGTKLEPTERGRIRQRLAYFTGLSEDYIERSDLQVLAGRFLKELLRSEGKTVGRIDGRYTGDDIDKVAELPDGDPSSYEIDGAYAAGFSNYIATELGVTMDHDYRFSGGPELGRNWKWRTQPESRSWEPSYVNVSRDLSRALRRNIGLRVMVAAGYFDFATPFFDAEYTFARHGFLPGRITMRYYEAGHMMYLHRPSLDQLLADVRAFIEGGKK
jgi:carboxypeptidase C (cathepsin A)